MRDITERQRQVLDFIFEYMADYSRAPTLKEIQAGCDYRHDTPVIKALAALQKKRYITRKLGRHRAIKIIRMPVQIHTNLHVA